MKPLTIIYWARAFLGLIIGCLCGLYVFLSVSSDLFSIYTLMTGLSFALLFYIATYYIIKFKYFASVEKTSRLTRQGIGIYFFAWIVSWTLIIALMLPSVMVNIYDSQGNLATGDKFWVIARNTVTERIQNVTTTSGNVKMSLLPPGTYTFELGNSNESETYSINWLQSLELNFNVTR